MRLTCRPSTRAERKGGLYGRHRCHWKHCPTAQAAVPQGGLRTARGTVQKFFQTGRMACAQLTGGGGGGKQQGMPARSATGGSAEARRAPREDPHDVRPLRRRQEWMLSAEATAPTVLPTRAGDAAEMAASLWSRRRRTAASTTIRRVYNKMAGHANRFDEASDMFHLFDADNDGILTRMSSSTCCSRSKISHNDFTLSAPTHATHPAHRRPTPRRRSSRAATSSKHVRGVFDGWTRTIGQIDFTEFSARQPPAPPLQRRGGCRASRGPLRRHGRVRVRAELPAGEAVHRRACPVVQAKEADKALAEAEAAKAAEAARRAAEEEADAAERAPAEAADAAAGGRRAVRAARRGGRRRPGAPGPPPPPPCPLAPRAPRAPCPRAPRPRAPRLSRAQLRRPHLPPATCSHPFSRPVPGGRAGGGQGGGAHRQRAGRRLRAVRWCGRTFFPDRRVHKRVCKKNKATAARDHRRRRHARQRLRPPSASTRLGHRK